MLTIHHLGISQSDRIVWLCEELGIDYDLKLYKRSPAGGGPAEYKSLNIFGTAPVITDGSLTLGESGAIIDYIIARYGGDRLKIGPEASNFTDYLYWFHFANGSMMPAMMVDLAFVVAQVPADNPAQRFRERTRKAFAAVETRLGEAPYFAGDDFTAADIIMHFPLTTMRMFAPHDISAYSNLRAYLARIVQRPAYQRARAKADPDLDWNVD